MKAQLVKHILGCDLDGFDCEDNQGNNYSIFWIPYQGEWLRLDYVGNSVESQGFDSLEAHIESLPDDAVEFACVELEAAE